MTLSERAVFTYLCTATYDHAADAGIRWNDAELAIDWPVSEPLLSEKDANAPFLADVAADRLPPTSHDRRRMKLLLLGADGQLGY